MHCHLVNRISRTSVRIVILVGSGYAGLGICRRSRIAGYGEGDGKNETPEYSMSCVADTEAWQLLRVARIRYEACRATKPETCLQIGLAHR